MTERLNEVEGRLASIRQLQSVIGAMLGIAAARSRSARAHLEGIRTYADTIAEAIAQSLAFLPPSGGSRVDGGAHIVVAICAEQGLAGSFSERVLEAAVRLNADPPSERQELMIVGDRGMQVAEQRRATVDWSAAMITHPDQTIKLANRIVEALYQRLARDSVAAVTLVHAVPDAMAATEVIDRRLIPFDFGRFRAAARGEAPLLTLSPAILITRLVEEYVFGEVCEALMLSFAAENEARVRAMVAARANVGKKLDELVGEARQLRQEDITNEIVELSGGVAANLGPQAGRASP
jgi:F-type H+-transporting ATPase subunit gamma